MSSQEQEALKPPNPSEVAEAQPAGYLEGRLDSSMMTGFSAMRLG